MTLNGNLILYACVARGTTILAEFNSKDAHLGEVAAKCLHNTPPLHSLFSHTIRSKTYSFLILHPFVYLGIFDQNFGKSRGLSFLNTLKTSFDDIFALNPLRQLDHFCFQAEFNPVFHQLITSPSGSGHLVSSPRGQLIGSNSLREEDRLMRLNKKNKSLLGGSGSGSKENNLDVSDDGDFKREFMVPHHRNSESFSGNIGGQQIKKAKRVWKKQVWIVLLIDELAKLEDDPRSGRRQVMGCVFVDLSGSLEDVTRHHGRNNEIDVDQFFDEEEEYNLNDQHELVTRGKRANWIHWTKNFMEKR
ncbi:hypothetical protein LguiA_024195 [Lonicera macranthoides]